MVRVECGVNLQYVRMAQFFAILKVMPRRFVLRQIGLARVHRILEQCRFLGQKDAHRFAVALATALVQGPAVVHKGHLLANGVR